MGLTRSSVLVAIAAPALACGCFALFSLDEYGPNRGPGDGGAIDDDDGGEIDAGDAGSTDAAKAARVMFVTNERFTGLMGGVAGADQRCSAAAADAGLSGPFVAWVASGASTPAARIPDPTRAIVDPNGMPMAANLAELAKTGPRTKILVTEKKNTLGANDCAVDRVWTNTTAAGALAEPSADCMSWAAETAAGNAGQLGGGQDQWTSGCPQRACDGLAHLYCFEK